MTSRWGRTTSGRTQEKRMGHSKNHERQQEDKEAEKNRSKFEEEGEEEVEEEEEEEILPAVSPADPPDLAAASLSPSTIPQTPRSQMTWLTKVFEEESKRNRSSVYGVDYSSLGTFSLKSESDAMFRFWVLVQDFKRTKDRLARTTIAKTLYTEYLIPSSPEYLLHSNAALQMNPSIMKSIERTLSELAIYPRNLFDEAQQEVWRLMRQQKFPVFLKNMFNAVIFVANTHKITTCNNTNVAMGMGAVTSPTEQRLMEAALHHQQHTATLGQASRFSTSLVSAETAAKAAQLHMNLQLQIPDVVFTGFVRFVHSSKWTTQPNDSANMAGNGAGGSFNAGGNDDSSTHGHSSTVPPSNSNAKTPPGQELAYLNPSGATNGLCAVKGSAVVNAPAYKVLDFITSVEERCWWDDLYGVGQVLETFGEDLTQLLRVDMYIPGGRNVVNNRDLLVLRSAKRMRDGACIYLCRSVSHPKYPPKPDVLRAEAIIAGFLVLPNEDRFTSTLISVSMLDPKGKVSATAVQSLNMMQARLPLRFAQYMRDVEQLHIERPLPSHIRPPFFVPTCYSYNGCWNPCPEAPVLGQHGPNNNSNANDTVKKEKEEQENNSTGAPQRERKGSKKSCPISAHISFMEAESVLVLSKGPINVSSFKSSSSSSTVKHWIGYHNGKRGLFDVDYVRLSDAASPVVAPLSTSSNSPLKHTSEEENRGTSSPSVNYTPFIELISRPNLTILSTICNHADPSVAERSALAFLQLLKITPGRTIPLLITLIANEVRKTNLIESSTLFRGHNIASHLLSAYCQLVGRHYLHKMVQPLVEKVLAFYSQGKSIEVDPARLGPHDNPHGNLQRLNEICSSFVPTTLSSLKFCPNTFRVICYHLQREVEKKFPDSGYIVLGGFFFLRFISPAIVSPEAFGVLDALGKKQEDITPDVRRGLVLVSKVIQNLANGVEFGEKEEHMTQLNSFIRSNIPEMERFFEEIASIFPDVEPEEQLFTEDVRPFARYLHAVVCDHLTDIILKFEQLERSSSPSSASSSSASPVGNRIMEKNGQSTFETLIQVLLGAGPAPPVDEKDINLEIALHGCYSSSFPLSSSSLSPSTSKKSKFLSIKGKKSRKSSGSGIATGIAVGGSGGASGSGGGGGSVIGGRVRGGVPNFERPVRKGKPRMFYGTISGAISHTSSSPSSSSTSSASSTNVSSSQETQQGLRSSDGSVATRGGPSIKELRSTFEAQSVHSSTSPSSPSFGKRQTVNNRPKGGSTTRPSAHSLWENGEIHRSSPTSSAPLPNHNTDSFLPPPNNNSRSSPSSPSSSSHSSSPIETRRRSATSPNVHIINHNKKKEKALNVEDSRSQTSLTISEKETKQTQKVQRKNKARFRSESFSMGDGRSNLLGSDGEESPSAVHQNASSPKRILRRFTFKDSNKRKEKHETLSKADSAADTEALHQALAKLQECKKQTQRDIEQLLLDSLTTAASNSNTTLRTKATKLEELRILLRVMEGHVCAIERLESRLNLPRSQQQASGSLNEFLSSSSPSSATSPRKWRSPAFVPANKAALPLRQQASQQMEQSSSQESESTATSAGEEQPPSASSTTTELPPASSTGLQVEDASALSGIAIGRLRPRSKSLWTAATTSSPLFTTTLASPSSSEAAAMERCSSPSSPSQARRGTGGFTSSTMRTKSLDHGHSYNPHLF